MTPDPEPLASARVEAYLDQLLVPLARNLSDFHREELRREMRAHLWERVSAYKELDHADEEAVTEALRQFGGAEDFARQWRQEWQRQPSRLTLRDAYEAGKSALRPTLFGLATAMLPFVLLPWAMNSLYASQVGNLMDKHGAELEDCVMAFALLILPAAIGARQGWRRPRRAGLGMLAALTAELVTASLVYRVVEWMMPGGSIAEGEFVILLQLLAAWLPLAGGAAAISGWWARRTKVRQAA